MPKSKVSPMWLSPDPHVLSQIIMQDRIDKEKARMDFLSDYTKEFRFSITSTGQCSVDIYRTGFKKTFSSLRDAVDYFMEGKHLTRRN